MALAANLVGGISFSFTAHASGDIFVNPILMEEKLERAAFVIPVSQYSEAYLDSISGYKYGNKFKMIYNSINLAEEGKGIQDVSARKTGKAFKIVSVGKLIRIKGFRALIHACRALRDWGYRIDCEIIGEGSERELLEGLIRDSELEDRVCIHGWKSHPEVYEALASADAFVLLAEIGVNGYRDGFPTVILEAMAMRLPVISTWISGIPEMVVNDVTGLLVHERDYIAAARAIERLVQDQGLRESMGNAGRRRLERLFNEEKNAEKRVELFQEQLIR